MKRKPYIIRISSQKGGVGKTTVAVNLACALSDMGYGVLLVDADTANPSCGFYLGLEDSNIGFIDVVSGKASPEKAIVKYNPTGLYVLPGTVHRGNYVMTEHQARAKANMLKVMDYDFIIVDTPPGVFYRETGDAYDEALVLTIPTMAATTSAMRLAHIYDKEKMRHSLVINRVRSKRFELSIGEMEGAYGDKPSAVIPEDDAVQESESMHLPAYVSRRGSAFSKAIEELAIFVGNKSGTPLHRNTFVRRGFFYRILRFLRVVP